MIFFAAAYYGYYAISHFASNGAKPVNQFLASHPAGNSSSVVAVPFNLTHGAASSLSPRSNRVILKHPHHPLQDFDAYSLRVRARQAAALPRISSQFRVAGSIRSSGSPSLYVIQSRSGVVHFVQAVRCSNFEGLEVCRWGGGYVSSAPLPEVASSSPRAHFVSASRSKPSGVPTPAALRAGPVPGPVVPAAPVHHHSILLPAHILPGGG